MTAAAGHLPENADIALTALAAGQPALVWRKVVADTETPVGAALKLIEPGRGDFLLESVEGGEVRGRYSLLGLDPDLVFRASGNSAQINRNWRKDRDGYEPSVQPTIDALRSLVAECRIDVPAALPPALACLVGYFGYETIGLVEKLPRAPDNPLDLPDMLFVRPTLILVFDGLTEELFAIAPLWAGQGAPHLMVEAAADRIDETLRRLSQAAPTGAPANDMPDMVLSPVMADGEYRDRSCWRSDSLAHSPCLRWRCTAPCAG